MASLDEVCAVTMGQAPPGDSYNTDGHGLPLIAGAGDFAGDRPAANKFTTAPGKVCQQGDIILGIRASIGAKVMADREYCLGRGVAGLRPGPHLSGRYLWHWLTESASVLAAKGRGATFLQVNRQDIGELQIPLPPLAAQRRIAAVLDEVDALHAKRRRSLQLVEELTLSTFDEALGKEAHGSLTVGDTAEVQGGLQVSAKRQTLPLEAPYLRVANVFRNRLDLTEIKTLRLTEAELKRTTLHRGDVLVVEGHGNPNEVGRAAIWCDDLQDCVHQNHLIRIRFDPSLVLPEFGVTWLNSRPGRRHLVRSAKTTSGLNTISTGNVKAAPVPSVALEDQAQFVSQAAAHGKLLKVLGESLRRSDALAAAARAKAFAGEM